MMSALRRFRGSTAGRTIRNSRFLSILRKGRWPWGDRTLGSHFGPRDEISSKEY